MSIQVQESDDAHGPQASALIQAIEPMVAGLRKEESQLRKEIRRLRSRHKEMANLSMAEAAEMAGISERMLQTLVHDGEVPSMKIGRRRLIPYEAFTAWLRRQVEASK